MFGKVPIGAIAMIANIINLLKGLADKAISEIARVWAKATAGAEIDK